MELKEDGTASSAGYAPYLDYRAPTEAERTAALPYIQTQDWLKHDVENRARGYAIAQLLPQHFAEVKARKQKLLNKTAKAVKERLTAEIQYWGLPGGRPEAEGSRRASPTPGSTPRWRPAGQKS